MGNHKTVCNEIDVKELANEVLGQDIGEAIGEVYVKIEHIEMVETKPRGGGNITIKRNTTKISLGLIFTGGTILAVIGYLINLIW